MKKLLPILLAFLPLALSAQLSSNKAFWLGTNNVLRAGETNFFSTNLCALTNALNLGSPLTNVAGGGGGGGLFTTPNLDTNGGKLDLATTIAPTNVNVLMQLNANGGTLTNMVLTNATVTNANIYGYDGNSLNVFNPFGPYHIQAWWAGGSPAQVSYVDAQGGYNIVGGGNLNVGWGGEFVGNGTGLTNVPLSGLNTNGSASGWGVVSSNGAFLPSQNGGAWTNLNASQLTSGTVPGSQLPNPITNAIASTSAISGNGQGITNLTYHRQYDGSLNYGTIAAGSPAALPFTGQTALTSSGFFARAQQSITENCVLSNFSFTITNCSIVAGTNIEPAIYYGAAGTAANTQFNWGAIDGPNTGATLSDTTHAIYITASPSAPVLVSMIISNNMVSGASGNVLAIWSFGCYCTNK